MQYTVVAVINREKNTQYELKCEQCNHSGESCRILITKDDHKHYSYVGMVNENCDDDFSDRHYYFHENNGFFYPKKELAEIAKIEKYIADCHKEIGKHKQGITYQENRLKEYEDRMSSYKEVLPPRDNINK